MANPVIQFSNVTIAYQNKPALQDVTLAIQEGEFLGIIGPNGSGKTTFLKTILGLILPQKGSVVIFDCACENLRCHHRARIGYLPQKELTDPNFPITVLETVLMGRYGALGLFRRPSEKDRRIAKEALKNVGLEELEDSPLGQLSGGQQQRVLIARALAQQPEILLLDEPTTGIDAPTQHNIIELIRLLHKELRLTILFVTHDINMISPFVDRLALFNRRLVVIGPPSSVLNKETLSLVYGKEVIVMDREMRSYVIVGDHHA